MKWPGLGGEECSAHAQAREANLHGGFLELMDAERYPPEGTELELKNLVSDHKTKARVSAIRRSSQDAPLGVAVELLPPKEEFWGLTFQLRRSTGELFKLEHGIKSGEIDPYVLREFRDAVDHIRKTAWAVQEWQQRQSQHTDPQSVISLVVAERLRRATQLCDSITADVAAQQVNRTTVGIEEFLRSLQKLGESLRALF